MRDPLCLPGTDLGPAPLLARALPLFGTRGQTYVEHRGVPVGVADNAGVRFDPDFAGRPAVLAPLRDQEMRLTSVHGRYLSTVRGQNKMLTVGPGNGVISVLDGERAEPIILVEGLFDALSLATCGWPALALIGRCVTWLPYQGRPNVLSGTIATFSHIIFNDLHNLSPGVTRARLLTYFLKSLTQIK